MPQTPSTRGSGTNDRDESIIIRVDKPTFRADFDIAAHDSDSYGMVIKDCTQEELVALDAAGKEFARLPKGSLCGRHTWILGQDGQATYHSGVLIGSPS